MLSPHKFQLEEHMSLDKGHPRYESLKSREKLKSGLKNGITTPTGLIAHGRGESLDYLLGEKTHDFAISAISATAAKILNSKNPILSVNGNSAVLVPEELIELSKESKSKLEINLYYDAQERRNNIYNHFKTLGAEILGKNPNSKIEGLTSSRADVEKEGMYSADFVLVMLEDGDRTEALIKNNKFVSAIDLNPLCRTSKNANITIVDNITRAIPLLTKKCQELKKIDFNSRAKIINEYNNEKTLKLAEKQLREML